MDYSPLFYLSGGAMLDPSLSKLSKFHYDHKSILRVHFQFSKIIQAMIQFSETACFSLSAFSTYLTLHLICFDFHFFASQLYFPFHSLLAPGLSNFRPSKSRSWGSNFMVPLCKLTASNSNEIRWTHSRYGTCKSIFGFRARCNFVAAWWATKATWRI